MNNVGYSGTLLWQKLGIKHGARILFINPPAGYDSLIKPLPPDVVRVSGRGKELDLIQYFVTSRRSLEKNIASLRDRINQNGALWISWPKLSSGVLSDLSEGVIRGIGIRNNLVDVKVCAVDKVWSGLKFVIPLKSRKE